MNWIIILHWMNMKYEWIAFSNRATSLFYMVWDYLIYAGFGLVAVWLMKTRWLGMILALYRYVRSTWYWVIRISDRIWYSILGTWWRITILCWSTRSMAYQGWLRLSHELLFRVSLFGIGHAIIWSYVLLVQIDNLLC